MNNVNEYQHYDQKDRWNHHDVSFWEEHRDIIRTKLGGVIDYPKLVCRGYDLLHDLVAGPAVAKRRPSPAVSAVTVSNPSR